jgi:16S rRNA (adenine1518-N6/adenine1519-N6)-dimethyltransferase
MAHSDRLNIRPKQSLGQNFLIDDNIARKTVRELHLKADDIVVEIGPGQGAFTKHLVGKAKKLFAVEIDKRVMDELRNKFQSDDVEIIHRDFLDVRLSDLQDKFKTKLRLVGNIPYHLTSPILFKAFEERNTVQDITMMIQREVARRITAKPDTKDYGILSVFAHYYGTPKSLFNVSPNCFYPKPKVTSTVIQIHLHDGLAYNVDETLFISVVRTAFGKRRKTLSNSLSYLPFNESVTASLLKEIDFPLDKRPEQLTVEQFVELTNNIAQHLERYS